MKKLVLAIGLALTIGASGALAQSRQIDVGPMNTVDVAWSLKNQSALQKEFAAQLKTAKKVSTKAAERFFYGDDLLFLFNKYTPLDGPEKNKSFVAMLITSKSAGLWELTAVGSKAPTMVISPQKENAGKKDWVGISLPPGTTAVKIRFLDPKKKTVIETTDKIPG